MPVCQFFEKLLQHLLVILHPLLTALDFLNDFTADQPVGQHHIGINRTDDIAPRLLKNGCNPGKQVAEGGWGNFLPYGFKKEEKINVSITLGQIGDMREWQ